MRTDICFKTAIYSEGNHCEASSYLGRWNCEMSIFIVRAFLRKIDSETVPKITQGNKLLFPVQYMKKLHMQERAVEEVKLAIKPFYQKREITKEEYKSILRKAVQKVSWGETQWEEEPCRWFSKWQCSGLCFPASAGRCCSRSLGSASSSAVLWWSWSCFTQDWVVPWVGAVSVPFTSCVFSGAEHR